MGGGLQGDTPPRPRLGWVSTRTRPAPPRSLPPRVPHRGPGSSLRRATGSPPQAADWSGLSGLSAWSPPRDEGHPPPGPSDNGPTRSVGARRAVDRPGRRRGRADQGALLHRAGRQSRHAQRPAAAVRGGRAPRRGGARAARPVPAGLPAAARVARPAGRRARRRPGRGRARLRVLQQHRQLLLGGQRDDRGAAIRRLAGPARTLGRRPGPGHGRVRPRRRLVRPARTRAVAAAVAGPRALDLAAAPPAVGRYTVPAAGPGRVRRVGAEPPAAAARDSASRVGRGRPARCGRRRAGHRDRGHHRAHPPGRRREPPLPRRTGGHGTDRRRRRRDRAGLPERGRHRASTAGSWACPGVHVAPLPVASYTIGQVSPATTGTFAVHASVTLTDGSTDEVVYLVGPRTAGAGCLQQQSVTSTGTAQTTGPSVPPTTVPPPATAPAPAVAPADVPAVPSAAEPTRPPRRCPARRHRPRSSRTPTPAQPRPAPRSSSSGSRRAWTPRGGPRSAA